MSRGLTLHTYLVAPDDGEVTEVRGRRQPLDALDAVLPPHYEGARFVGRMREDDGEWSRFTCVATAAAWVAPPVEVRGFSLLHLALLLFACANYADAWTQLPRIAWAWCMSCAVLTTCHRH